MIHPDLISNSAHRDAVATATLRVDMIADLICPWCYLGKRRLDAAFHAVHGPSVFRWLPYQLNPGMPDGGMGFEEYLASKFGDPASVQPGLDELTRQGNEEGIRFRFDLIRRVPKTLDAHCLLAHAAEQGADVSKIVESILSSFFEEGLDIGQRDVLLGIGNDHGLERLPLIRSLDDSALRDKVLKQEKEVRRGGVSGVPGFLINDRLFVIGAQPTTVLVDAFGRAMFGEDSDRPVSDSVH